MEAPKNKKRLVVKDTVLIGDWDEVKGVPLSTFTKSDADTGLLDGLIVKGYETKFNVTNENGERYAPNCLDDFVREYFVEHKLNLVVDLQHSEAVDDQVGRVIYLEVNAVGFYFVAYIPRTVARYEQVKNLLKEGILQGFSKYGYAMDYELHRDQDGVVDYINFTDFRLCSVSLVTMPANAIPFESIGEPIKDGLQFVNLLNEETAPQPTEDTVAKPKKKSIFKSNV